MKYWGIPLISKDRSVRVKAIAEELAKGDYDVVSLQEVWSKSDYEYIKSNTDLVFPYAHYFHSGVVGSGLCILSKYPIITTLFHMWSVNGYVHRIQHGDWFGGKGVGLCKLLVNEHVVNVYIAHLHAEYDRVSDDYKAHRVIQAFDTAQFIETTRGDSILQVLAGDLNTEPGDLAYRVLLSTSKMKETYLPSMGMIGTNEVIDNTYTSEEAKAILPHGKRIDYIWYRPGINYKSTILEYKLPFPRLISGLDISYSDHEAVYSKIQIEQQISDLSPETCSINEAEQAYELSQNLKESIDVCDQKLTILDNHKRNYFLLAFGILFLLLFVIDIAPPYGFRTLYTVVKIIFSGLLLFCLFMATLWHSIEANGILSGKLSMDISLKNAVCNASPSKF